MGHAYAEVVKVVQVDPTSGAEIAGTTYYGVACGDDEGYAVTRSTETLAELERLVGDLGDEGALLAHAREHYPDHLAGIEL